MQSISIIALFGYNTAGHGEGCACVYFRPAYIYKFRMIFKASFNVYVLVNVASLRIVNIKQKYIHAYPKKNGECGKAIENRNKK